MATYISRRNVTAKITDSKGRSQFVTRRSHSRRR